MQQYKEKILKMLVDKYRKSKKDTGTNQINRRTKINPAALYSKYYDNDGDMDEINAINEVLFEYREKGFLTSKPKGFGYEMGDIYLVDSKIDEIEKYLCETYGIKSKNDIIGEIQGMLKKYESSYPIATDECDKYQNQLEKKKIPKEYHKIEDILKALVFIENNKIDLYIREASMLIYGSSKYFEENILDNISRIIRAYMKQPCREDEMADEILKEFHISKERQRLCLKGDCTIYFDEDNYCRVGIFGGGIEFDIDEMKRITKVEIHAEKLITIENKTSYHRYNERNTVMLYLGGYTTRFQRDFLKQAYLNNPHCRFFHFGDIDAGGFFIHEHLCHCTEIPFQLLYMSVEQLEDERFASCLQPLTENDCKRLKSLQSKEFYAEVTGFMLQKQVKLEQEIVSFYL